MGEFPAKNWDGGVCHTFRHDSKWIKKRQNRSELASETDWNGFYLQVDLRVDKVWVRAMVPRRKIYKMIPKILPVYASFFAPCKLTHPNTDVPAIWNERTNRQTNHHDVSSRDIEQHFSNNANQPHTHTHEFTRTLTSDKKCSPMAFQNDIILLNFWCVACVYLVFICSLFETEKPNICSLDDRRQTLDIPEACCLELFPCLHGGWRWGYCCRCLFIINYARFNMRMQHDIQTFRFIWNCVMNNLLYLFCLSILYVRNSVQGFWILTLNLLVSRQFFMQSEKCFAKHWSKLTLCYVPRLLYPFFFRRCTSDEIQ